VSPRPLVGLGVAAVLAALAALHAYWAVRGDPAGRAPGSPVVPTRPDGRPLFRPGGAATLAVAIALTSAAVIVLGCSGVLAPGGLTAWYRIGAWGVGAVLLLRAVGDFRYVGLFKRERRTPFARLDTRVYSPLCAALAAGVLYLAASP